MSVFQIIQNTTILARACVIAVGLSILVTVLIVVATIQNRRLDRDSNVPRSGRRQEEIFPERVAMLPSNTDYDSGYQFNTTEIVLDGYTVTFWTDGCLYDPGNGINGYLRIEATSPPEEGDFTQFLPMSIHVAALRFADRVKVREDEQVPHFHRVRRERMGIEAHLVDLVSTSSWRIGQDEKKYLPHGQYVLRLTLSKGSRELGVIDDIYIEVVRRHLDRIFDADLLRKASRPKIAVPRIRGFVIEKPTTPDPS